VSILPGKVLPERYISGVSKSPYSFGSRQEGFLNNLNPKSKTSFPLAGISGIGTAISGFGLKALRE
jgi:hypothetical protein